jgi:hypothetical protein
MRQDLANLFHFAARDADEIVADTQQGFPFDLHLGLKEEVEVFNDRTGERVLDGYDCGANLGVLHAFENLCGECTGNNGCLRFDLKGSFVAKRSELSLNGNPHLCPET